MISKRLMLACLRASFMVTTIVGETNETCTSTLSLVKWAGETFADDNQTQLEAVQVLREWQQVSACMNDSDLIEYYIESTIIFDSEPFEDFYDYAEDTTSQILCIIGLVGSILVVSVIYGPGKKEFEGIGYVYVKLIAWIELTEKVSTFIGDLYSTWLGPTYGRTYAMEYFRENFVQAYLEFATLLSDCLTLAMSLDRAIALLNPSLYIEYASSKMVAGITCVAVVISLSAAPRMFKEKIIFENGKFDETESDFWSSKFATVMADVNDILVMAVTVSVFIVTCFVIFGLQRARKRKAKLQSQHKKKKNTDAESKERKDLIAVIRLSTLLLLLAIPMVIYGVINIFDGIFARRVYFGKDAAEKLCLTDAITHIGYYKFTFVVDYIHDAAHRFAHDSNFLLYIIFLTPFRKAFKQLFATLVPCYKSEDAADNSATRTRNDQKGTGRTNINERSKVAPLPDEIKPNVVV